MKLIVKFADDNLKYEYEADKLKWCIGEAICDVTCDFEKMYELIELFYQIRNDELTESLKNSYIYSVGGTEKAIISIIR